MRLLRGSHNSLEIEQRSDEMILGLKASSDEVHTGIKESAWLGSVYYIVHNVIILAKIITL